MILDFENDTKEAVCPHCGAAFRYRLLGRSMCEFISELFPSSYDDSLEPAKCG
jgi:hypothetical protein